MDTDIFEPKATASEPGIKSASGTPRRKPRGFLIALFALVALLVLGALALYLLPHFLPIDTIRGIVKTKARELAGVDVDFGNLSFGWNGDVVVDAISVSPLSPDGRPGDPLLTIDEVRTNVALMPLLSGKAIVNSVEVNGFAATVRRKQDGTLNIPDFANLPQSTASELAATDPAAADAAAEPESGAAQSPAPQAIPAPVPDAATAEVSGAAASSALPPVEIHHVSLNNGALSYVDETQNLSLAALLQNLTVEGQTLDDPFVLSGRLIPYAEDPALGDLLFKGRVAMLQNGQFNPQGEATLDAEIVNVSLRELAAKFGLADLLRSARTSGEVRAQYIGGKIALNAPEFRIAEATIGLADGTELVLPDSTAALNALFDSVPGTLDIAEMSLTNDIAAVRGKGRVNAPAAGGFPAAAVELSGAVDLSRAAQYAQTLNLGLESLPDVRGKASFTGNADLPAQNADGPLSPRLELHFNDGDVQAFDRGTENPLARIDLKGLGVRAAATLGNAAAVNASVNFAGVPGSVFVREVAAEPVSFTLNGGAAMTHSPEGTVLELLFENTEAALPATEWSSPATVKEAEARLRFDLTGDRLRITSLRAALDDAVRGGVTSGEVTGILAGSPAGQADIEFSGVLEQAMRLAAPVVPAELVSRLAGALRGAARVRMEGGKVETVIRSELANAEGALAPVPESTLEFRTPRAALSALASLALANPDQITLQSLEASAADTAVRMTTATADGAASRMNGGAGAGRLRVAGVIDLAAGTGNFSALSVDVNGINLATGRDGREAASLAGGLMQIVLATPEQAMRVPLSGQGDFAVPGVELGADSLAFRFNDEESQLGNVRAKLAADGYIGPDKRQVVNLRTATLTAAPIAVNARGALDLGSGAALAEYAARVAPAGISSLLGYLGLPPSLLTDAAVTGTVAYNGNQVNSKGAAQGRLQTAPGETSPFEMAHDLSASWNTAEQSLSLDIRRFDGSVKTPAGESVAAMAAQPSKLLLSAAGSKGLLDLRVNGSAAPGRQLALGLAGVIPQMADLANTISQTQTGGVYNAWLQVRDLDPTTLSINVGGEWQGAALAIAGTQYLAEAEKLSANLAGELALQEKRLRLSRLLLRSDSGMVQADGTAALSYTAGADNIPSGIANLNVDARFVMADLAKAARVFPGVIPGDLGMTGRIDGTLKAGGDAANIDIAQAVVNFQQFAATPAEDMNISIPSGSASFDGLVALHMNGRNTGSPYDALTLFDLRNGTASMQGLHIRDKAVNEMSSSFSLQNGILALDSAKVTVGGGSEGSVQARGRVDFSAGEPAVNMQVALRNLPLSEVNSELKEYMQFRSGNINLPAQTGQAFGVSFRGFDEDSILRTLALENFTFATGRVAMETGPALNAELDKARVIMRQNKAANENRLITFSRIEGTASANGSGVITIPESAPVNLVGEDTGNFRAQGTVSANHTMDMRVMVAGQLENLIGFTLPNIIPNLGQGSSETGNSLMDAMNASAAQGKYGVNVTGALESPDISGIGALAGQFLQDMLKSQLLDGVVNLGKDAPKALLNLGEQVVEGLTHPGETLRNAPENILKSPENVVKGLGSMFGLRQNNSGENAQQQQQNQPQPQQRQEQQQVNPRDMIRGLFGGGR